MNFRVAVFDHGEPCWQGPTRSTKVRWRKERGKEKKKKRSTSSAHSLTLHKLRYVCGPENQILSVEEPSRCVYEVKFATPAACYKPDWVEAEERIVNE